MIELYRDDHTSQYGLKQWKHQDGSYGYYLPIEDDVRPSVIKEHGTKVVLCGRSEDENTIQAPPGGDLGGGGSEKFVMIRR
jgi:hypothetical protein